MIGHITDVAISHIPGSQHVVNEVVHDLQSAGLTVESQETAGGPFAGLEWFLPAAISVFIAEKYFGTILEEAGKDTYKAAKAAIKRLAARTTGPNRLVRVVIAGTSGKVGAGEPVVLGIYAALKNGQRVKFIFEHDLDVHAQDAAVESMHEAMAAHYRQYPHDRLSGSIAESQLSNAPLVVLRFDHSQGRWTPWRPSSSARSNER